MTATFYFPITPNTGFLYLINLYFLYHYSTRLETGETAGLCSATHTHTRGHRRTLNALFVMLNLFLFVFQGRSMANLQTISSCCSSTGSALLYPLTGIIKHQTQIWNRTTMSHFTSSYVTDYTFSLHHWSQLSAVFSAPHPLSLSLSLAHCAMSGWLCASGPVSVYPCRAEKPNLGHMQHQQYSPAHISTLCRFVQRRLSACLTFHVCKTNLSV